jgi:hypothetical protein
MSWQRPSSTTRLSPVMPFMRSHACISSCAMMQPVSRRGSPYMTRMAVTLHCARCTGVDTCGGPGRRRRRRRQASAPAGAAADGGGMGAGAGSPAGLRSKAGGRAAGKGRRAHLLHVQVAAAAAAVAAHDGGHRPARGGGRGRRARGRAARRMHTVHSCSWPAQHRPGPATPRGTPRACARPRAPVHVGQREAAHVEHRPVHLAALALGVLVEHARVHEHERHLHRVAHVQPPVELQHLRRTAVCVCGGDQWVGGQ